MIALKSQVRDLLQKLESKERCYRNENGTTGCPEKCDDDDDNGDDDDDVENLRDDRLTTSTADDDDLCSLIERLNEQVRIRSTIKT